jgi:hypothetical protein
MLGSFIFTTIFRTGKSCMGICKYGLQIDDLRWLSSGSVTGCGGCHARQRCSRLLSPLSASDRWRCPCSTASPVGLKILGGDILARKGAGGLVSKKHCRVSLYRSLHLIMPRKLNTPLVFSELGAWFLNKIFRLLSCGARNAFFGHCGHIQPQANAGLFQLYPTSVPWHSCRYVENLQDITCYFSQ